MGGKEIVSHQAAQLEITKCLEDPLDDMRTNLVGTINVLEAARRAGVAKVVNASSACIYGQAVDPPTDEDAAPHNPNWSYGASKLAAEKYAQIFSHDYGFPVFSLRYGITYGPREWYGRVLTIFLKRLLEGQSPGRLRHRRAAARFRLRRRRRAHSSRVRRERPPRRAFVQRRHRHRDLDRTSSRSWSAKSPAAISNLLPKTSSPANAPRSSTTACVYRPNSP